MDRQLMRTMVRAARGGGRIVRRHFFSRRIQTREKSAPGDMVTNVDLQVEQMVMGTLKRNFPGIDVVSEEISEAGVKAEAFYVDPLDGTLNFIHGLPPFAVSLGYWKGGVPQAAVVCNPLSGELFSALRGGGALRNGKPIGPSSAAELRNSLLATG
jgi:myo-inositol-1(or 4)-monophosphatase